MREVQASSSVTAQVLSEGDVGHRKMKSVAVGWDAVKKYFVQRCAVSIVWVEDDRGKKFIAADSVNKN